MIVRTAVYIATWQDPPRHRIRRAFARWFRLAAAANSLDDAALARERSRPNR